MTAKIRVVVTETQPDPQTRVAWITGWVGDEIAMTASLTRKIYPDAYFLEVTKATPLAFNSDLWRAIQEQAPAVAKRLGGQS